MSLSSQLILNTERRVLNHISHLFQGVILASTKKLNITAAKPVMPTRLNFLTAAEQKAANVLDDIEIITNNPKPNPFQKILLWLIPIGIAGFIIANKLKIIGPLHEILKFPEFVPETPDRKPRPKSGGDDCIPLVMRLLNEYANKDPKIKKALNNEPITERNLCNEVIEDLLWDVMEDPRIDDECVEKFEIYWHKFCNKKRPKWPPIF